MKHQTNPTILNEHRPRELRNRSTDVERILWQHLRGKQVAQAKFRRQHALGDYVVDFVSLDARLIIELDGGQHAASHVYDQQRDAQLRAMGFEVLRFWNNDIIEKLTSVLDLIHSTTRMRTEPHPPPGLPLEGGGTEIPARQGEE